MASIGDIFFSAALDDSRLQVDAKRAGDKAGQTMGTSFSSKFSKFGAFKQGITQGLGIGAFNLVGTAISKVTDYLGDAAQAYRDDQVSVQKLTTALRANAVGWDGNIKPIEDVIAARMKLGFSDDEQRSSLGELVAAYGDVTAALDAERTAMDLARFSGVDLATASDVLIKVHAGNYRALKTLGINTANITNQTEALAAIQKVASGQAEDYANTLQGKLDVAEVKAGESSEKFGKSVARLQAVILPAVADAVSGLADELDGLQTGMDDTLPATDRADAALQGMRSSILGGIPGFKEWIASSQEFVDKERAAEEATTAHDDAMKGLTRTNKGAKIPMEGVTDATADLTTKEKRAASPTSTLSDLLTELGYKANDAEGAIHDLADKIANELYGDAINAGHEAELKEQIKDLEKQRSEVKKNSPEWRRLTGEIAQNREDLFNLHLEMAASKGPEAAIEFLKQERRQLKASDTAARNLIDSLILLYSKMVKFSDLGVISFGRYTGKTIPTFAEGGHYEAGVPRIVGEHGMELDVPDHSGTIYPDVAAALSGSPNTATSGSGGWATMGDISISVDARGLPNANAVGSAVRQGVHDAMADVLRQQTARLPSGTRA